MLGDKKYFSGLDLSNDGVRDYKDDVLNHSFFSNRDKDEEKSSLRSYSRFSILDDDDDYRSSPSSTAKKPSKKIGLKPSKSVWEIGQKKSLSIDC